METQLRDIISLYIKIPADQINSNTIIDRTAVSSSILLHRMYAHLAKENFAVADYWDIKDFGSLQKRIDGQPGSTAIHAISKEKLATVDPSVVEDDLPSIGIDIEQISNMPVVNDYREDEFYRMNFAPAEIAYCILQSNPAASFAGLFAAKEAIVKANKLFLDKPFNAIYIDHLPNGKPVHPLFKLSISHSNDVAIAVAVALPAIPLSNAANISQPHSSRNNSLLYLLAFAALFISVLAMVLHFFGK